MLQATCDAFSSSANRNVSYSKQIKIEKPAICEKAAPFAIEAENDIAVAASAVTWLLAIVDVDVDVDVADIKSYSLLCTPLS